MDIPDIAPTVIGAYIASDIVAKVRTKMIPRWMPGQRSSGNRFLALLVDLWRLHS